jgi:type IV pilus assembly protein PilY1
VVGNAYSQGGVCYYVVKNYTSLSTFGATDIANVNAAYVAGSPTSRTIYTKGSGTARLNFNYDTGTETGGLTSAQKAYFEKAHIAFNPAAASTPVNPDGLSQFCYPPGGSCLSATAQDNNTIAAGGAAGQALVNYLRGDRTYEGTYFRGRKHVLGDIVSSEARYVKAPLFSYTDVNYSGFKTLMSSRRGMVYVASNDGMLHGFDSETGQELWAYVPAFVLPDLYKLADKEYSQKHQFYVDGSPEIGDICDKTPPATCLASEWKTILVGGLNRGGKGFYALDITDPANPQVLWEFTDTNMGYTYGNPRITKLKSGVWVVMLTSGYNNADGKGYLYVLNAKTGAQISGVSPISTNVGSAAAPSGLARIAAHAPSSETDNTTLAVYGGDLLGNLWRFDVNNDIGTAGYDAHRMVTFLDSSGVAQPVTAKPVVATIDNYPVVYVGTGKYLGLCDISNKRCVYDVFTANDVKETMYAVKDNSGTTTYANPQLSTSGFVRQTLVDATCTTEPSCTPGEKIRKIDPTQPVSWGSQNGWYVNFLSVGERANTDPSLALGSLVFTTNNPNIASVAPCGEPGADTTASWLYTLDARTGGAVLGSAGVAASSLGNVIATRPVLIRTPDGTVYALIRTSGGSASNGGAGGQPGAASGSGFFPGSNEGGSSVVKKPPINLSGGGARRVSWREVFNN